MWSCELPNASFVWMPPLPGATVRTPSATFHGAGPLPLSLAQCDRSLPSNRTMASDGGSPGFAPGVTSGGSFEGSGIWPGTRACWAVIELTSRTIPATTLRPPRNHDDDAIPRTSGRGLYDAYNPLISRMRALIAAVLVLLAAAVASAQPASSTLIIDLTDATGTILPGVSITVVNQATAVERQAIASE